MKRFESYEDVLHGMYLSNGFQKIVDDFEHVEKPEHTHYKEFINRMLFLGRFDDYAMSNGDVWLVEECYSKDADRTFVMKSRILGTDPDGATLDVPEFVGWYFGEPERACTNKKLIISE